MAMNNLCKKFSNRKQNPREKAMRYWKTDYKDGTYKITYIPEDVGEHKIVVKFDGQNVQDPIPVESYQCGDADQCKLMGMK